MRNVIGLLVCFGCLGVWVSSRQNRIGKEVKNTGKKKQQLNILDSAWHRMAGHGMAWHGTALRHTHTNTDRELSIVTDHCMPAVV